MTRRGLCPLFLIVFGLAAPLAAQTAPDDRVAQLERRLNELTSQVTQIRQELDQLKSGTPAAAQPAPAEEDLTKVEVAPAAAPASTPSLTDVQTVNNAPNPSASKVFNPDTSVIGNFMGHAGPRNTVEGGLPFRFAPSVFPNDVRPRGEPRDALALDEAEVAFEAFVDPYAKAKFFLSASPEGLEIEEGYANFVNLPYDITAKVGKMKALFGKANTWHTHVRPWVDQPLVIHNFFGDEQLNGSGISASKVFPNRFNTFVEGTAEVYNGNNSVFFRGDETQDLTYVGHLKAFRDITENSNIEIGGSYARGKTPQVGELFKIIDRQFAGVDVTYRWKPLMQGLYRGLISRTEALVSDEEQARRIWGFYSSLDYQLGQRWFTGLRIDRAGVPSYVTSPDGFAEVVHEGGVDRGVSATLTFWPSEFSQIRGQLRRTHYGIIDRTYNELLLQLQFAIGAHGAHTF